MSRKELNDLLTKALGDPAFQRPLAQVLEENATRPVRACRCVVLEVPETAQQDQFPHIVPGTVTAFVAREGEPLLQKLAATIQAKNSEDFTAATTQIQHMAAEFSRRISKKGTHGAYAAVQPHAFPSFAEIGYANKTLVGHPYIDDVLRVQANMFPYNGGSLDHARFSMMEYYQAGTDTPLTCLFLIRRPTLSDIEKEALRLVPSSASANNIGVAAVKNFTPALLAVLVVAAEVAAEWLYNEFVNWFVCILHGCETILASIPDKVLEGKDFQHTLKSLPPEVTAAELVRLRTELLLQKRPK